MTAISRDKIIAADGNWTAMAIKLSDGGYTKTPAVDHRLKRLLQVAQDIVKKPLSECRVLDLACLEGHYAIEFAMHGAEAVGVEGRAVSVTKCDFAKNDLKLDRVQFYQDDVRNLSKSKYGTFDIVICSGILYHLKAQDAANFLRAIYDVCEGVLLLDTFVALSSQTIETLISGRVVHGHHYFEHSDDDDDATKQSSLWASLDNAKSFWFTEPTLMNLITDCGFTSVLDVLTPTMPKNPRDRKTYLAIKGERAAVRSSDITRDEPFHEIPEGINPLVDASQTSRSKLFKLAKRILPPSLKNAIKPALRAARILPPDTTPDFLKKNRQ